MSHQKLLDLGTHSQSSSQPGQTAAEGSTIASQQAQQVSPDSIRQFIHTQSLQQQQAHLQSNGSQSGGAAGDGESGSDEVHFDWSALEAEISLMEQAEQNRFLEEIALNSLKIDSETDPFAPLPTQNQTSRLLHQAVIEQFQELRKLNQDPKKKFRTAKARRREMRQRKAALQNKDKLKFKLKKSRSKASRRKNAKY